MADVDPGSDWVPIAKANAGSCPICGRPMELKGATIAEMYIAHRCPESTLRAIDGASERGEEPHTLADPANRSERQKRNDAAQYAEEGDCDG